MCVCVPCSVVSISLQLNGPRLARLPQARILEWVVITSSRGFPDPGIEPGFPALQANSLPSEPPGKPFLLDNCVYFTSSSLQKSPWLQKQRKPHPVYWSPETFTANTENRQQKSTQPVLTKNRYPQTPGEKLLPMWEGRHLRQWPSSYLVRNDIT